MSHKKITIVLGVLAVILFGLLAYLDAVRTWQHLQDQQATVEGLDIQYNSLDKKLEETKKSKLDNQRKLQDLEKIKSKLYKKKKNLESSLQSNVPMRGNYA